MAGATDPQFTLSVREEPDRRAVRISLVGEVDHSNHQILSDALDEVAVTDADEVVIDCRHLEFIDSAGLGVLARARAAAGTTRVEVQDASPAIERLLTVVGLDR